jgi:hypothetical protein
MGPADTTPPTVSVTAPAPGATVNGTVTVSASASDNVGVLGVQFYLDTGTLGPEDTTPPYSVPWTTTSVPNGNHTLYARARDAAGNVTTSTGVDVIVFNVPDTQPPTTPTGLTATAVSASQINLAWNPSTDNVGVVGYAISRGGAPIGTSPTTTFADAGLAPSTPYSYTVAAFDAAGLFSPQSLVAATTTLPPPPPLPDLVAAYSYNEGAGTTAADSSPTANPATLMSGAGWASGYFGGALLPGATGYAQSADVDALTPGTSATWEAWVYLTSPPTELASIVNKWSQTAEDEYLVALDPNRSPFFAWKTTGGGAWGSASYNLATGGGQVALNAWTHVAVVRNGATLSFYLNGTLTSSTAALDANPFRNGTNSLRVGGQARGGVNRFFPGHIDEARIYSRALTQAEIQIDMNAPVGFQPEPVMWTSLVNATAWSSRLRKTSGCDGCPDGGAVSVQSLQSGVGYLEFVIPKNGPRRYVGFGVGGPTTTSSEIAFGFHIQGSAAEVRESDVLRASITVAQGDTLRISVGPNAVSYSLNGLVFHVTPATIPYPLFVDTSLFGLGAEIAGAVLLGASAGTPSKPVPEPPEWLPPVWESRTAGRGSTGTSMATATLRADVSFAELISERLVSVVGLKETAVDLYASPDDGAPVWLGSITFSAWEDDTGLAGFFLDVLNLLHLPAGRYRILAFAAGATGERTDLGTYVVR